MFEHTYHGTLGKIALRSLAAAALVVSAACSGDLASLTAPAAAHAPAAADFSRSGRGRAPDLRRNDERYHDRSRRHGHGEVGNVDVEGIALLGADHLTRLTLSTGTVDPLVAGPGEITKVKVKAYDPKGVRLFVTTFDRLTPAAIQALTLRNLMHGAVLEIRAHVRSAKAHRTNCGCRGSNGRDDDGRGGDRDDDHDRSSGRRDDHGYDGRSFDNGHDRDWNDDDDCDDDSRTDVVTLTDTVKAGAALSVDLQLPPTVLSGTPTVINAVVTETGGDVGTRADCQLYVGGKLVDTATGIWVDAGDAVTCAFTYTFTGTGRQNVEVRVNGTSTGGSLAITANDTGSFDVVTPQATHYTATAQDRSATTLTVLDYTWWNPNGGHKEYSDSSRTTDRLQSITVQGTLNRVASFPLAAVDLTLTSAGFTWEAEHWTGMAAAVDASSGQLCVNQQMTDQGAVFYLCNGLGGATFGYTRFAGTVTYHSWGFSKVFDGVALTQNDYTWNDEYQTYQSGGQVRNWGTSVALNLNVVDLQGAFGIAPVIPLTAFSSSVSTTPRTCVTDSPYWLEGGTQTTCNSGRSDEAGMRGSTTG